MKAQNFWQHFREIKEQYGNTILLFNERGGKYHAYSDDARDLSVILDYGSKFADSSCYSCTEIAFTNDQYEDSINSIVKSGRRVVVCDSIK